MVDFTQSVQLSHAGATSAVTTSARIVREENEFADDHHAMRRKLTLLLPESAAPQTGDGITYSNRNYEITAVRHCRGVAGGTPLWRIQAVG